MMDSTRPASPSWPARLPKLDMKWSWPRLSSRQADQARASDRYRAMGGGIHVEAVAPPGLEGITAFAADALPALIVMMACLGAFGPAPDFVASGINPGRNVGRAVLHSGTVGAALTCVHFGLRGLATSIWASSAPLAHEPRGDAHTHFESAAALAVSFAAYLEGAPARTVFNLNVPDLALGEIRGVRRAGLSASGLILAAQAANGGARVQIDLGTSEPGAPIRTTETSRTRP